MKPIVLTIAGSDPSGGAGVQSDLRTIDRCGLIGISLITTITAQNTVHLSSSFPVPINQFIDQAHQLLEDIRPDVVKIGAVPSPEHANAIADLLDEYVLDRVVYDPVTMPTAGVPLASPSDTEQIYAALLPRTLLLTPNLGEAAQISGFSITSSSTEIELENAALNIAARGPKAVLVKGGHRDGAPTDLLLFEGTFEPIIKARVHTEHTHGTGCLLSTLLACQLASAVPIREAVRTASAILVGALTNPFCPGKGRGYPVPEQKKTEAGNEKTDYNKIMSGVYYITDDSSISVHEPAALAEMALIGGAKIVQYRAKGFDFQHDFELCVRLRELCRKHNSIFIVNDRVDLALVSGADGVHLGPGDMASADARKLLGPRAVIGASVNSVDEARSVAEYVNYFGVGAIFGTQTKADAGEAIGREPIQVIAEAYPNHPIVAIGGINAGNVAKVAAAGASMVAVISAIARSDSPIRSTQELAAAFAVHHS